MRDLIIIIRNYKYIIWDKSNNTPKGIYTSKTKAIEKIINMLTKETNE